MFRYINPNLFPQDASADYFQSLAPSGYAALFRLLAYAGINPLLASKAIPAALSLIAAAYFFGFACRFFRSPAAAGLTTVLFSQCLWLNSDLASATPRAFFYPLFAAFLYYHLRHSTPGVLSTVTLGALFFPPVALLSLGVLGWNLLRWEHFVPIRMSRAYLLLAAALILTLLCLWPYLHQTTRFGPLVTYAQAREMPEFGPDGRVPFFLPTWWGYWVGGNGGVHNLPTRPSWFLAALLWPILRRFPRRFPLLRAVPRGARPVPQIIGAALSLFALAHFFLFRLYLPNRYTMATTRVVLILLAGGVILALLDAAWRSAKRRSTEGFRVSGAAMRVVSVASVGFILAYPLIFPFPTNGYMKGTDPGLYRFFARQPATIQIASLADEAANLPLLCQRSVIVSAETAVPFHPAYYLPLRERGLQIARAQYTADAAVLERCLRDQSIDFWVLDRKAFSPRYWRRSRLLQQLRASAPEENLGEINGAAPLLKQPPRVAIAYKSKRFVVLDARRLSLDVRGGRNGLDNKSRTTENDFAAGRGLYRQVYQVGCFHEN
ncbi:MAG: hypothetical protein M3Q46_01565 [Verrucomicrobiota bacterium]|nr:hypothetical protein [Verrucomicrobiota bacterium]